jgi:Protein of unknown function (DUF1573)
MNAITNHTNKKISTMKKLFFAAVVMLCATLAVQAQTAKPAATPTAKTATDNKAIIAKGPKMQFAAEVIDYGKIKHNSDGNRVFKFKNTGDDGLVITSARGSCGCTVPTYSETAIAPGKDGEIKVRYATDRVGPFTKTVTVTTNEKEGDNFKTYMLTIKGEVMPAEEQKGTPEKSSNPFNNN